ncbi:hypothetical protein, partial [uncultured Marinobacter sp.]|uniref:hypothetical protein n=1 Tax=uncultured Marinobacter sp. TaxID=187379 RepID=UPI0030D78EE5
MQQMTAPPKPKPMQPPQQMQQPVQGMQYGGMVGQAAQEAGSTQAQRLRSSIFGIPNNHNDMNGGMSSSMMPYMQSPYQNFGMPQQGSSNGLGQYGEYIDNRYGDPQFDQKRAKFLMDVSRQEQQTFGGMGGFNTPQPAITERPGPQRNLGDSEYLSGIFGSQAGDYQDLANYQVAQPMADGGAVSTEPLKMALGGFIGNSSTRDYGGDRYTDPYEELDDLYEDVGGYDPTDPYGDNSTAGDDSGGEDDYGYLDDDYVYVPPTIAEDLVVVPPPEESSSDSEQRMIQDLIYGSADPTIGPNNAQEALDQANADFKAGRGDIADLDLATLASRISRGSDVMPASLGSIDAISRNFAVPEAADTTFSDPDEI